MAKDLVGLPVRRGIGHVQRVDEELEGSRGHDPKDESLLGRLFPVDRDEGKAFFAVEASNGVNFEVRHCDSDRLPREEPEGFQIFEASADWEEPV